MIPSPFVFYRGAAAIMASDLAYTPSTGIRVQACGDAHLMNVGVGSVSTFCAVILMMADVDDPLFLQVKEAGRPSWSPTLARAFMRTTANEW